MSITKRSNAHQSPHTAHCSGLSANDRRAACQRRAKRTSALVADVGGTNTRIALARGTRLQPRSLRRYLNCRFASLEAVIARYLQEHRVSALAGGCVAVAGPVACGRGNITHLNWDVDTDSLAGALGIPRFSIINDLQAVGHALQLMRPEEIQTIVTGRAADPSAARLVINVGTGFNAAAVHTSAAGRVIPPSECGHAGLPAAAIEDPGLKQRLQDTVGFVTIEDVLSGPGLSLCHS